MEKSPANTGVRKMSDVAMARGFVEEIGDYSKHRRGNLIDRVHEACSAYAARLRKEKPEIDNEKIPNFSHRRIRSFWNLEAAVVSFSEMVWLSDIAAEEKGLAEHLQQERKHHAEFIAETLRLASFLEGSDPDFMGGQGSDMGR